MSCSSSVTVPSTRAVGTVSCIRFRHRKSVDLPHPDGPMIAVTSRSRNAMDTSRTTFEVPNRAESPAVSRRTRAVAVVPQAAGRVATEGWRGSSVATAAEAGARGETGGNADDKDDPDEDERARPRKGMLRIVWADGVGEDLQRECRDRLVERNRPEAVAKCREEQRRGLAGDARDRDQRGGDDPWKGRAQYDDERRPPPWVT